MAERTCVVCRGTGPKQEFFRFILDGERLVFDPLHRLPGRGAYCHRDVRCLLAPKLGGALVFSLRRRTGEKREGAWDVRQVLEEEAERLSSAVQRRAREVHGTILEVLRTGRTKDGSRPQFRLKR